jgi:hypothetical protein
MLPEFFIAFSLLALCVIVHAAGLSMLLQRYQTINLKAQMNSIQLGLCLVHIAWWLLLLHLLEIALWAFCYCLLGCLPDLETAFYFSGSSYATVGYGDIILPKQWRMLGPAEGLAGILLCGLSTGFFFAVVSRIHRNFNQSTSKDNANQD